MCLLVVGANQLPKSKKQLILGLYFHTSSVNDHNFFPVHRCAKLMCSEGLHNRERFPHRQVREKMEQVMFTGFWEVTVNVMNKVWQHGDLYQQHRGGGTYTNNTPAIGALGQC